MKRFLKLVGTTVAAFAMPLVMFAAPLVHAQDNTANGFRISPVRNEVTLEPGKSQSITINLENPTSLPVVAKPIVNDFVASDSEDGEPKLILDDKQAPRHSLKKLVGKIPDVSLGPKERKEVKVTVAVPAGSPAGGYYGAIRFSPAEGTNTSSVGLTASVGSLVLVKVPGNLQEKLELVQFSAASNGKAKSVITSGNPSAITRIRNTGDIHLKPFGSIIVKNMFGKTVDTMEINNTDPRSNILPESQRKFVNDLKKQTYIGRYTMTASIAYEQGSGDIINAKTTFWYLPTWLVITLLVLLVVLLLGAYVLFRRMRVNHRRHKPRHR